MINKKYLSIIFILLIVVFLTACSKKTDMLSPEYKISTDVNGKGSVIITPDRETFRQGEKIELKAVPKNEDWVFDHWEGALTGKDNPVNITADSTMNIVAVFRGYHAPVIADIEDEIVAEGQKVNFKVFTSDPDGDEVRLSVSSLPEGANFDPASGEFSWTTTASNIGSHEIKFTATDGKLEVSRSVQVEVTARLVFTSLRDRDATEIYVMNDDGTNPIRLTNNTAEDENPVWSPDRSRIAFVSDRDGKKDIYVMNADGTNQINISNKPDSYEYDPSWSPDGSRIVFESNRSGNHDIFVMDVDGSNLRQITTDPGYDGNPSWSPDGSLIAFESDRDNDGNREIYVMNTDGTNQTKISDKSGYNDESPNWSPDGSRIAFHSDYNNDREIYVMNADGSDRIQVTNNPSYDDIMPSWSPDGLSLAYSSGDVGGYSIYKINVDGTYNTQLSVVPVDLDADWN